MQAGGYEVIGASTGAEALLVATTTQPDMIILGLPLPDSHGLTILEKLNDPSTASVPVIILSIADDDGQGRLLGAVAYLNKLINEVDLLERIADIFADPAS